MPNLSVKDDVIGMFKLQFLLENDLNELLLKYCYLFRFSAKAAELKDCKVTER